jgi:hypothetical protein
MGLTISRREHDLEIENLAIVDWPGLHAPKDHFFAPLAGQNIMLCRHYAECPLWLEWNENGIQFRKSAKTRTWEIANKAARKLEEELDLKALGIEPPKKADHISIQSATDLYLKDMAQRGIKDPSKARRMLFLLRDYANGKNVILLKDVTARLLTEWRSGWTFRKDSDSPAVHWSVVKTFFLSGRSLPI